MQGIGDSSGADGAAPRIGSAERETAVAALREHLEDGRLTPEEYEERSVTAARARTWAEVAPLFADLPDPRPAPVAAELTRAAPAGRGVVPLSDGVRERVMAVMPMAALVLFFVTKTWLWFLLIPIAGALLYGSERHRRR